jgi:Tfp pilus assembly protein PilO
LLGVIIVTAGLLCGVYFLLIQPQNQKNVDLDQIIEKENRRLKTFKAEIKQMDDAAKALAEANNQLNRAEEDVATGDLYAWTVDTIRRFKVTYHHVDIPTTTQPAQSDCDLIGNFPYKQIRFTLNGTAHYHDLGQFISDFENKFPHCRVLNLTADPISQGPNGSEKLNFQMDIVALVKPVN